LLATDIATAAATGHGIAAVAELFVVMEHTMDYARVQAGSRESVTRCGEPFVQTLRALGHVTGRKLAL